MGAGKDATTRDGATRDGANGDEASRDGAQHPEAPQAPSVNQVREEPVPASHDDDRRPRAVERNEEEAETSAPEGHRPAGGRD
jgi:hypothetical protein